MPTRSRLTDEIKLTHTEQQRLVEQCDRLSGQLRKIMLTLLKDPDVQPKLLELLPQDWDVPAEPGTDWYHYAWHEQLAMLAAGEITESGAAYYRGTDIVLVRVEMEEHYGLHWRDFATLDGVTIDRCETFRRWFILGCGNQWVTGAITANHVANLDWLVGAGVLEQSMGKYVYEYRLAPDWRENDPPDGAV